MRRPNDRLEEKEPGARFIVCFSLSLSLFLSPLLFKYYRNFFSEKEKNLPIQNQKNALPLKKIQNGEPLKRQKKNWLCVHVCMRVSTPLPSKKPVKMGGNLYIYIYKVLIPSKRIFIQQAHTTWTFFFGPGFHKKTSLISPQCRKFFFLNNVQRDLLVAVSHETY